MGGKLGRRRGQLNALGGLIFLQDSVSKQQFLVDTGAAVSVRSASPNRRAKSPDRRARSPDRCGGGRQPPRRSTPGRPDGKKLCWIHKKYGVDATSCRPGCEWTEN